MDDRILGVAILLGSLLGVACYFWLVFLSPWALLTVQVSAFSAVAAFLAILAWIGYTLATTPPPTPFEDLSFDEMSEEEEEAEKPQADEQKQ